MKRPKGPLRAEFTNLPNIITYVRVLLIPVVLWFVVHDSALNAMWAAIVYSLASITDALDGYVARVTGQVSTVGKFLDPLADKLAVTAVLVTLLPMGRVPAWVVVLLISRELAITGLRAVAAGEGLIISASDSAKTKTAFQLIGVVSLLVHYRYDIDLVYWHTTIFFHDVGIVFLYMSLFFSLYSAGSYFRGFVVALAEHKAESA
jgi:CDP-diacylglycerol---glycerol-3-phosphate 3-phosphatidyltransferase